MRLNHFIYLLWTGLLFVSIACSPMSEIGGPPMATPVQPDWNQSILAEHIGFFNRDESQGRILGTAGYLEVVSYVAARLGEFEVQPAAKSDFRSTFYQSVNLVTDASLTSTGSDTLEFQPGVDFQADARSDSGEVVFSDLIVAPAPQSDAHIGITIPPSLAGQVVLVDKQGATTDRLIRLRAAGANAVLVVDDLTIGSSSLVVPGLLIARITPQAAGVLLGGPIKGDPKEWIIRKLPLTTRLYVSGVYLPITEGQNVLGFIPGKHPVRSRELVIVCADLDGDGIVPGGQILSDDQPGQNAAALLEVARNYNSFSHLSSIPERTLLFAFWSGKPLGFAGLKQYLERPVWPLDQTVTMIYIGLDESDVNIVRELLTQYDLPLTVVGIDAEDRLDADLQQMVHSEEQGASAQTRQETNPGPVDSSMKTSAVDQAAKLAESTHLRILDEVIIAANFRPLPGKDVTPEQGRPR